MVHARAVVPVFQTDDERGVAAARAAGHHAVTADHGVAFQFGNLLHLLLHLLYNLLRLMQGAAFRSTNLGEEHALVFLRHET